MSTKLLLLLGMVVVLFLGGCGDPYKELLPKSGHPTPSQAQKLADGLPAADKEVFTRWTQRIITGEQFGGELPPRTVRDAITNQVEFEARRAELAEQEVKQKEVDRLRAVADREKREQEVRSIIAHNEAQQKVHAEIQKYLQIKAESYEFQPLVNSAGYEVGRQWVFHLRVTNSSNRNAIGAAGLITLRDAFGKDLGLFSVRLEFDIQPGKVQMVNATMTYDRNNATHQTMAQINTFFPEWLFESVAYKDGTRIDKSSLGVALNVFDQFDKH